MLLGWLAGVTYYAFTWYWILKTIARVEDVSPLAATPFFILFAVYHGLQLALFAALLPKIASSPSRMWQVLLPACWWVLLEWSFPRVIPWYLGDTLGTAKWLRQIADLGGASGLSFLIVLINMSIAAVLARQGSRVRERLKTVGIALMFLGAASLYGAIQEARYATLATSRSEIPQDSLGLTLVQGNLASGRSDRTQANEKASDTYEALTKAADTTNARQSIRNDLFVWPETVLRVYVRHDEEYLKRLDDLSDTVNVPLLLGALDLHANRKNEFNSAYLVMPDEHHSHTSDLRIYRKRWLLPFGEYAPAGAPWRTTGDFVPGPSTDPFTLSFVRDGEPAPSVLLAPSICYEAIFPGFFNEAVRRGAGVLINITDDGWFGDTAEPYQHLNATILRAVETRRWLARASNSAISAFIDPSGEIVGSIPLNVAGVLTRDVEMSSNQTVYVRFGNWIIPGSDWGCSKSGGKRRIRAGLPDERCA